MTFKNLAVLFLILLVFSCSTKKELQLLGYEQLVNRLTDLKALATLPVEGEISKMWSSYDRASKYDSTTGSYINWDYNNDGFEPQYIRKELLDGDSVEVIAEMEGPGLITRIWSATPKSGHVKIFLDDKAEPAVDLPFEDYFSGKEYPFNLSELNYIAARGKNCFTPIPYQKSCKIIAEKGWGQYYQINYTQFPKGTIVPTFSMNLNDTDYQLLVNANERLKLEKGVLKNTPQDQQLKGSIKIKPSETIDLANIKETSAIKAIRIKPFLTDSIQAAKALRTLSISIKWDGKETAAIWAPLGDFFGSTPGYNQYYSLPMGMDSLGWMYCHWYMPSDKALIQLKNEDEVPFQLEYEIVYEPLKDLDNLGRFHAKWHRDIDTSDKTFSNDPHWLDWELLKTKGKGRFVGLMLNIWNPRGLEFFQYAWPGPWWWGEGDEKFFIDGEKFPSFFGTGTEDYFGYAWCDPGYFDKAFHSQSYTRNNTHQTICRWHLSDNIPFQESFNGYIEKYYPNFTPTQYSGMLYWYLEADGEDPYRELSVTERYGYQKPFFRDTSFKVEGVVEMEDMEIVKQKGTLMFKIKDVTFAHFDKISNNRGMIMWTDKEGIPLDLIFSSNRSGEFIMSIRFLKSIIGSKTQIYLNNTKVGNSIDTYGPKSTDEMKLVELGKATLKEGENTLRFELVGENENRHPAFNPALLIDYISFD